MIVQKTRKNIVKILRTVGNREVKGIYAIRKQLGTRKGIKWAEGKAMGKGLDESQV